MQVNPSDLLIPRYVTSTMNMVDDKWFKKLRTSLEEQRRILRTESTPRSWASDRPILGTTLTRAVQQRRQRIIPYPATGLPNEVDAEVFARWQEEQYQKYKNIPQEKMGSTDKSRNQKIYN